MKILTCLSLLIALAIMYQEASHCEVNSASCQRLTGESKPFNAYNSEAVKSGKVKLYCAGIANNSPYDLIAFIKVEGEIADQSILVPSPEKTGMNNLFYVTACVPAGKNARLIVNTRGKTAGGRSFFASELLQQATDSEVTSPTAWCPYFSFNGTTIQKINDVVIGVYPNS